VASASVTTSSSFAGFFSFLASVVFFSSLTSVSVTSSSFLGFFLASVALFFSTASAS
jgi:hypothetical protein